VKIDHARKLIIFSDPRQDLHNISMGISSLSEEVKEIAALIDEQRENAVYLKNLEHFRDDARAYLENARESLIKRYEIIGSLKSVTGKEIQIKKKEEEAQKDRIIREQEKLDAEKKTVKKVEEKTQEIAKRRDELTITKKTNILKELSGLKGLKIKGKKIEDLTQEDIASLKVDDLEKARENHIKGEKEHEEKQNKKVFNKYDYLERARRETQVVVLQSVWEAGKNDREEALKTDKANFDRKLEIKAKLLLALPLKTAKAEAVLKERKEKAVEDLKVYKEKIQTKCRDPLLTRAQELLKESIEKEEAEKKKREEDEKKKREDEATRFRERIADGRPADVNITRGPATREDLKAKYDTKPQEAVRDSGDSKFFRKSDKVAAIDDGTKKAENAFISRSEIKRAQQGAEEAKEKEIKPEAKLETPMKKFTSDKGPAIQRNLEPPRKEPVKETTASSSGSKFERFGGDTKFAKGTGATEGGDKFSKGASEGPKRFLNTAKASKPEEKSTRSEEKPKEEKPREEKPREDKKEVKKVVDDGWNVVAKK